MYNHWNLIFGYSVVLKKAKALSSQVPGQSYRRSV